VPDGPATLLTTGALSVGGKLRLLFEPWASGPPAGEESVDEFARRRIGPEAADVLVDAAVSGISAGDARLLSLSAAFPLMAKMEQEHGSLIRALVSRRRTGQKPAPLRSFRGGMGTMIDALTRVLGPRLTVGLPVTGLERTADGWRVTDGAGGSRVFDQVALALPARGAARVLVGSLPALAETLATTPFSGVAVVALAFREEDLPRSFDGYGYLVPRAESLSTLGVVRESALFEGRAPAGHVLVRVVLGGARDSRLAGCDPDALTVLAGAELACVLGPIGAPVRSWVFRWPAGIAQYVRGHDARKAQARALLAGLPGLHLCGTSYDGVSFVSAIASGRAQADRILGGVAS
jgi:oxygen-dependent protoporphyrinogen oxidase